MANTKKHFGETKRTSVILSKEVHDELKSLTTKGRSMSDIIAIAVAQYLKKRV